MEAQQRQQREQQEEQQRQQRERDAQYQRDQEELARLRAQPKAFFEFIRDKDYGLSASLPPDKKTLNKFRRFTGRADGLSISFEQHLLGSKVEFDEAGGTLTLTLRGLPRRLTDQLKRAAA